MSGNLGSWKYQNLLPSKDPYSFGIDDSNFLTKQCHEVKSETKPKRLFKNNNVEYITEAWRYHKESNSQCYGSQKISESKHFPSFQIVGSKLHKQNKIAEVGQKANKFFKSRNACIVYGEKLRYYTRNKRSSCTPEKYGNVKYSPETNHYLIGTESSKMKFSTIPDKRMLKLIHIDSSEKKNYLNRSLTTKIINQVKENSSPVSITKPLHKKYTEESTAPFLNEDSDSNLSHIRHNAQNSSHPTDPLMLETETEKEKLFIRAVVKPNNFFKSRNIDTTLGSSLKCYEGRKTNNFNCALQGCKKYDMQGAHYHSRISESGKGRYANFAIPAELKMSHSPKKRKSARTHIHTKNLSSIKEKILAPMIEENKVSLVHKIFKGTSHLVNESVDVLSVPEVLRENKGLNSHDRRRYKAESNSSCHGKNWHLHMSAAKKCSLAFQDKTKIQNRNIAIFWDHNNMIKNNSSVALVEKNANNTNAESIYTENKVTHDVLLVSGINDKEENVNKDVHDLVNVSVAQFYPVARNLSGLNIQSYSTEKSQTQATTTKTLLEKQELCRPILSGTDLMDSMSSRTEEKSPCKSMLDKHFCEKVKLSSFYSESGKTISEICGYFETKTKDIQFSFPSQQVIKVSEDLNQTIMNTFTDRIMSTYSDQNCIIISSQRKHRQESKIKSGEIAIEMKENSIPKHTETLEETSKCGIKCATGQINNDANKTDFPIMKKNSNYKKHIFSSDRMKKSSLLYRPKWVDDEHNNITDTELASSEGLLVQPVKSLNYNSLGISGLVCKSTSNLKSSVFTEAAIHLKNNEISKRYFTVIRNVKTAHQIQELGELQEISDDVEYILDALQNSNPIATRCHSAVILASRCLTPAFRKHIKAHSTVAKFSHALQDAAKDQSLALCTATVIFILSLEQLNEYLNYNTIELLLNLLNSEAKCDSQLSSTYCQKIKNKILELLAKIQSYGYAKHLNLDNITVDQLALEALLSLACCHAGHQFKKGLMELGFLEHIIKAMNDCSEMDWVVEEWREPLLAKQKLLDSYLQVLEHIINQNEENQLYVLKYKNELFIHTLATQYRKCTEDLTNMYQVDSDASKCSAGVVVIELLLRILKTLITLTHNVNNKSLGNFLISKTPVIINTSLYVLLQVPHYIPEERRFDLLSLVLMFLINTVEHNACNRKLIFEARAPHFILHSSEDKLVIKHLIELFYHQEKLARMKGLKTDSILNDKIGLELSSETLESKENFIAKLLQKAGQNMEYTMIASYLVLLIGYLITDNEEYETFVRQCLPQKNFSTMILVLEKMYSFMNLVSCISSKQGIKQTHYIIHYLKQSDIQATKACNTKI